MWIALSGKSHVTQRTECLRDPTPRKSWSAVDLLLWKVDSPVKHTISTLTSLLVLSSDCYLDLFLIQYLSLSTNMSTNTKKKGSCRKTVFLSDSMLSIFPTFFMQTPVLQAMSGLLLSLWSIISWRPFLSQRVGSADNWMNLPIGTFTVEPPALIHDIHNRMNSPTVIDCSHRQSINLSRRMTATVLYIVHYLVIIREI